MRRGLRAAFGVSLVAAAALPTTTPAHAQTSGQPGFDRDWTTTLLEEDDFWSPQNKDRHYTHGIRLSATTGNVETPFWQAPFDWLGRFTPAFQTPAETPGGGERVSRRYNLILLGQNMYTPDNPTLFNPDRRDRPYAGWLYSGIGLMQDTPGISDGIDRFDELALKVGIVGPGSLANYTQTRYHLLIHVEAFKGWHAQLRNEWAGDLFYEHKRRYHAESKQGWGWDAIPQWDLRLGNVYDYAGAGGMLRLGRNLRADWGPPHVDLNTGADYINTSRFTAGDWGGYVFVGGEARAVAHDIFLDGNDFKTSASVQKIPLVGDVEAGLALFWGHYRLAYTYIFRTPQFLHQDGPDHYGSLGLTLNLPF